jgi:hypothetical protein
MAGVYRNNEQWWTHRSFDQELGGGKSCLRRYNKIPPATATFNDSNNPGMGIDTLLHALWAMSESPCPSLPSTKHNASSAPAVARQFGPEATAVISISVGYIAAPELAFTEFMALLDVVGKATWCSGSAA